MPEITPEQREAAWQAIRKWTAAIGSEPQDPDYALDALIAEGWGPVADVEAERDAAVAKFEANDGIHGAACAMIRDLLNSQGVPKAAFIDDHVANAIVERNIARDELAAAKERIAEQESLLAAAEARGYRAGVEDAAKLIEPAERHDEGPDLHGSRTALRHLAGAIRALADKPKETPHG